MTPEHYRQIDELLDSLLELEVDQRPAFLDQACPDQAIRREVEALLAAHDQAEAVFDKPAMDVLAEEFANNQADSLVGINIGSYKIISFIGAGGMGEVYLARDTKLGRKVALKLLPEPFTRDRKRVQRFQREARAISSLNHPNILTIHEIGRTEKTYYIATEFVDGVTLRERMLGGPITLNEVLDIIIQVVSALEAAHQTGIIHRDIKPENIMVRRDGYVKVLDFGLAKLAEKVTVGQGEDSNTPIDVSVSTEAGMLIGTARYMSPEQVRGLDVDARTDIWSLGVVLYELITGHAPFTGETQADIIAAILTTEPALLEQTTGNIPFELRLLIGKALRKKPEERYQTSDELLSGLKTLKESLELRKKIKQFPSPPLELTSTEEDEQISPLLSEFDFSPRLQNWLQRNQQGGVLALSAAAVAMITILLSCFVGAACIRVTLKSDCSSKSHELLFGYLAELNAGALYLIGVPIIVITVFHLLNLMHVMLRRLVSGKRLIVLHWDKVGVEPTPLAVISQGNRRLCRTLIPLFIALTTLGVCIPEYLERNKLAFGWVQALTVQDLTGKDLTEIRQQKNLGEIPFLARFEAERPECTIRVSRVVGGHGNNDKAKWFVPFLFFVAIALGLQIAFTVFALWITTKIVFLFVVLSLALLDRPRQILKIVLDFEDRKKRFGLGVLDILYNVFLTMVLIASVILVLQRLTNVAKGSNVFSNLVGSSLIGQTFLVLIPSIALLSLLIIPVLVFIRLIETALGRYLERLDKKEAELQEVLAGELPSIPGRDAENELKVLYYKRELAQQQRPWPRENLLYRWLMLSSIIFLFVIPPGIEYAGLLKSGSIVSNLVYRVSELLCVRC